MPKKHHLLKLISELGLSVAQFEKEIGVGASTINKAIERNSKLGFGTVYKILDKYPNIRKEWLETGEGSIYQSKVGEDEINYAVKPGKQKEVIPLGKHAPLRLTADQYAEAFGNWKGLPVYNVPITASFIETYRDETNYQPQYFLHDPRFRDCDFGAVITGDSMHSEIRHGDIAVCKYISDPSFIVYGDIYYVVAANGLETCKYVARMPKEGAERRSDGRYSPTDYKEDEILLVAYNRAIDPSPIKKEMIIRLYKVRGIVRGY